MMKFLKINLPSAAIILIFGILLSAPSVLCQKIKIDTASARAVLRALQDPGLTYDQALIVARLEGNQGMVHEMRNLSEADTDEQFANALVAAAHGQVASSAVEVAYNFTGVKNAAPAMALLLNSIESSFEENVRDRIRPFSPKPDSISLRGFVVAGGDGGGYAFGGTDFYLNLLNSDDLIYARQTMIHEAFHGVQGATFRENTDHWNKHNTQSANLALAKFCSDSAELFKDIKDEGTAMFVGSDEALKDSNGVTGKRIYAEYLYYSTHLSDSTGLLEVSVASLQAPRPVPFKTVYGVDFWGKGVAYYIGNAMTRAIEEEDGPAAVAESLQQPGYEFILRYIMLKSYGRDSEHPQLGENTVAAAQALHDGCHAK